MNSKLFWEITEGQEFNFRFVKSQRKAKLILNKKYNFEKLEKTRSV